MRMLLLCVATFAAGLMAGSLVWNEPTASRNRATRESRPADEFATADDGAHAAETRGEEPSGDGSAGEDRSRNADLLTLTREASAEIDRAKSSERAEAILEGDGEITGSVRDPAGEPVAGVVVTALPDTQPRNLAMARRWARQRPHENRDLGEVAREAIEGELWRRYARQVAKTDARGRFELKGLMDTGHALTAFHESYDVTPLSQRGRVQPDAVVDFLARPVAEIRVEVRLPDGSLAEYAWLRWQGPEGNGSDAWTEERGTARFPLGTCKVKAQTWLPEPMESAEVERLITANAADGEALVLQLEQRRVLTARLVLPEGFALPKSVAYRLRLVDREDVEPESLLKEGQKAASSPSAGRAYWIDLEPGRYLVAAFLDGRRLIAHADIDFGAGAAEVDLPVDEPDAGSYVTVRLLGPDGGPIPGPVSFRVVTGPENRPKIQRADALQSDGGAWLVFVEGLDTKQGSDGTLRVGTRNYGGATHPFNLRGGGRITIRLDKPARLGVNVHAYSGSGVEGALYAALRGTIGADAWRPVSADGTCDLGGVQPGDYRLLLYVRKNNKNWPIYQRPINLSSGEEELDVTVPTLHELKVRWAGKAGPRNVVLRGSDENIGGLRRDARLSGRTATFDLLAPGTYEVECARKRATIRVPGPEVVLP